MRLEILALLVLTGACGPRSATLEEVLPPPSIQLQAAEFFDYQGGELRAHGFADQLLFRRDTGDAQGKAVRVGFPGRRQPSAGRGGGTTWIEAPLASGNPMSQTVDGSGGVTLRTEGGGLAGGAARPGTATETADHGATAEASYRGQEGRAFGKSPVALWGPSYRIQAPGFTLDTLHDRLDLGPATLVTGGRVF